MSWLTNPEGKPDNRPKDPSTPTLQVLDPSGIQPGRKVEDKTSNRPFLAHKQYQQKRQAAHDAWVIRNKARDEAIARGEKVGKAERDPTYEEEVGCLGLLKLIVITLAALALAGKFVTGSYLWKNDFDFVGLALRTMPKSKERLFSERLLAQYDGTDPDKPLYIAVDGDVFDVSAGRATYGPGGSYASMAGIDAARSFATGCFATHRTHDLRGLSDQDLRAIDNWKKFFTDSKKYHRVGRVIHAPINPSSPIPPDCNAKQETGAQPKNTQASSTTQSQQKSNEEL